MKIYTKTGDKGETSLLGGRRVRKSDLRVDIYGRFDEINSQIGYLNSLLSNEKDSLDLLVELQRVLFSLGSLAASEQSEWIGLKLDAADPNLVKSLEHSIDKMNEELPELTSFVLPSGHISASWSHVVRTNVRSLERALCGVDFEIIPEWGMILINRLSDYFFVLSRYLNFKKNESELNWP